MTIKGITAAGTVLLASATQSLAIEGLQLSVHCPNVVLGWPSTSGEYYIVQWRTNLDPSTPWVTLTNSLPADGTTNWTIFMHSNQVQCSSGGTNNFGGGGGSPPTPSLAARATSTSQVPEPLARRADGSGSAVPLCIYPPGFDLSRFIILDPSTGDWVSGSQYAISQPSLKRPQPNDPDPQDDPIPPDPGFYRVVANGLHFFGLTNGVVLSGVVDVPIEMSLTNTDQITGLAFYAGDSPLLGASDKNNGSPWMMEWDTTMVPNGIYAISAGVNFEVDDSVTSSPVTITVNNAISFPNYFSRVFGDQMWIYAELATPEADFEIAMYADGTNYIGSFYGTTYDGIISFPWDLTDGGSYTFTNETFSGDFFITPLGDSPAPSASNFWVKEPNWQYNDNYVVAYAPFDTGYLMTSTQLRVMLGGEGGEYGGVIHILNNYGLGANLSPGNVDQSSAFALADSAARTNLLQYLADSKYRNFYFWGHGSPSAIGGITSNSRVTADDVAADLLNVPLRYPMRHAAMHPYRFVFLDGCSTGAGTYCESFGIPAQTVNNAFFSALKVQSRAFLGFKSPKSFNPSQWTWYAIMIGGFYDDWLRGYTLQTCVNNAVNGVHTGTMLKMDSSWVIYGATDLTRDTDTRK